MKHSEIQEQAEKEIKRLFPYAKTSIDEEIQADAFNDGFMSCAKWMQEREKSKTADLINYIENDAEIAVPIEDLMGENGNGLTKKEYGLVLLKHLVIELRDKFLSSPPKD